MTTPGAQFSEDPKDIDASIREVAARWIVRRDRGLSATESIEFELWLAEDERHAAAIKRSTTTWAMLDRLPDSVAPDIAGNPGQRPFPLWWAIGGLAAGLAITVGLVAWRFDPVTSTQQTLAAKNAAEDPSRARVLTLPDGTTVRLNSGTEVLEEFTPQERRVRITRGEAHFTVTKNQVRPFVVRAGTIEVSAVGTAFNVNLQSALVDVLVTEGSVHLKDSSGNATWPVTPTNSGGVQNAGSDTKPASGDPAPPLIEMGQRAVISLQPSSPAPALVVTDLTPDQIAKVLAWQNPLLRLGGATLAELAAEFQRQTGQRIELADSDLAQRRIGGRFRADDVDGFVRLLEENYGIKSQRTSDGAILLRKNP
jgi:transmembrane sensor